MTELVAGAWAGLLLGIFTWQVAGFFSARYTSLRAGSARQQAVVIVVGLAWGAWVGARAASMPLAVTALLTTALLVIIALVDWRTHYIPNQLVAALLFWAMLLAFWQGQPAWPAVLAGSLAAGAAFGLLYWLGRGALGLGDVKLAAALGALCGFPAAIPALLVGMILGGVAAAGLLFTGRARRGDALAYGPYLLMGAWLVLTRLWGLWPGS
ncbi:MAG: A24 family peptidase [Anaerolineae bacterium]